MLRRCSVQIDDEQARPSHVGERRQALMPFWQAQWGSETTEPARYWDSHRQDIFHLAPRTVCTVCGVWSDVPDPRASQILAIVLGVSVSRSEKSETSNPLDLRLRMPVYASVCQCMPVYASVSRGMHIHSSGF
jgi:hypothetical protein